jgi:hypothetical protein
VEPEGHYNVLEVATQFPILSQMNPVRTLPSDISKTLFNRPVYVWVFQMFFLLQVAPPKLRIIFSSAPCVLCTLLISSAFIL